MGKALFVAGTDTNVGKTSFSLFLMNYLEMSGHSNLFLKPIETGIRNGNVTDFSFVYSNLPFNYNVGNRPADVAATIYRSFLSPCSPHLAVMLEDSSEINLSDIGAKISGLMDQYENLVVEGAGGVCVPVNSRHQTFLEVVKKVGMSTILVSNGALGSINSTCLSVQYLRHHGVEVLGFAFNDMTNMAGLGSNSCKCANKASIVESHGFSGGEIVLSLKGNEFSFDKIKEPLCDSCLNKIVFVDNSNVIAKMTRVPFLGFVPYAPGLKKSAADMDHELARDIFARWVNVEKILYFENDV